MGLKDLFASHAGTEAKAEQHSINVEGMHCNACEKLVGSALEDLGATDVSASHQTGVVTYRGELDRDAIAKAVSAAGFELA